MENNNNININPSIKKDENTLNLKLSNITPEIIDNININQEINQKNDNNSQKSSIKKSIQLNSSIDSEDYKSAKSHISFFSVQYALQDVEADHAQHRQQHYSSCN